MATDPQPVSTPSPGRRGCVKPVLILLLLALIAAGAFALWAWITLSYDYSEGERAGYIQKFSSKGWICKTWEGELAVVHLPGAMPEIFHFSVRDDAVAEKINQTMGQRVTLHYEQHIGVPGSCFGESDYYVTAVRGVKP
ncbi:MAG TPA: hypothetical protein VFR31_21785 [Thermoanaerobaculia bacterium]|nr:hypothetical protein [Thermoanaerobaculia bacterium]